METALVTGASRRLGALIAADLALSGAFVWIHYRSGKDKAETLCQQIISRGGAAACVRADLTNTDDIDRMLDTIGCSKNGALTTLINNASLFIKSRLDGTSSDDWDRLMNTNLKSVWYLSTRFAVSVPSAKRIITIGDSGVSDVMTEHAVYGLSKYALKYLTKQMAVTYAPKIRVNLLSPGLVLRGDNESETVWKKRQERVLLDNEEITSEILSGIRFLMTDPGMTGSELLIDNGLRFHSKR